MLQCDYPLAVSAMDEIEKNTQINRKFRQNFSIFLPLQLFVFSHSNGSQHGWAHLHEKLLYHSHVIIMPQCNCILLFDIFLIFANEKSSASFWISWHFVHEKIQLHLAFVARIVRRGEFKISFVYQCKLYISFIVCSVFECVTLYTSMCPCTEQDSLESRSAKRTASVALYTFTYFFNVADLRWVFVHLT